MQQFNLFSFLDNKRPFLNCHVVDHDFEIGYISFIGPYGYTIIFKNRKDLVSYRAFKYFYKVIE